MGQKIKGQSYRRTFAKYGISPKSLQWTSKKAAQIRYEQLLDQNLQLEGKSILDVGCGFGDIVTIIESKANNFQYTGVDFVSEFIEVAKLGYPKYKFLARDYFENPLKKKFDIVMTCGSLNGNLSSPEKFRYHAIKTMWAHAKYALAFNMAGYYPQPKNRKMGRIFYADSLKILNYCLKLSTKVIFKQHYSVKNLDFTIIMFK